MTWTGRDAIDRETTRWLNASAPLRYGIAIAITVIALVSKYALLAVGLDSFYLLLVPAVVVAALLGGFGPGMLVTIIVLTVSFLTFEPAMQISIADPQSAGRLALYLVDGVLLSALAAAFRTSMRQLAASRADADLEHRRTALLQDLTARLASQSDSGEIARAVLDRSSELVDCDRAWIVAQEGGALRVLGAFDAGGTRAPNDEDAAAAGLAARVIATGEELWSEAGTEEHDQLVSESPAEFGASAAIAVVPLYRATGAPFGALLFGWRTDHVFKPANRDLKRAVARITAQSLERAELYAAQAARISDLAERETVRDAFLAVLSHELRTPVTTIFGVSAILGRTETDAGTAELLRDIQEEAERLRRIVDDLLVLSRSERGAIEISPEPILLQRTVGGIVDEVARRYPSANVTFHAEPVVPAAMADPTALVQVIYNLVTNAIKYAGQDGPIAVTVDSDLEAAAITVADHGPGLGNEPDAVFALFHRADHTKRRAAGTGIGLYVARELVRAMGGEIVGRNRSGGGAEFRFTLPFAEHELAPPPLEPSAAAT